MEPPTKGSSPSTAKRSPKGKGKPRPQRSLSQQGTAEAGDAADAGGAAEAVPAWAAALLREFSVVKGQVNDLAADVRDRSVSRGRSMHSARADDNLSRQPTSVQSNPRASRTSLGANVPRHTTETEVIPSPHSYGQAQHGFYRPSKPSILDDGVAVKFWAWRLKLENLFQQYPSDFATLNQQLGLMLDSTAGKAQHLLQSRVIPGSAGQFEDVEEIWECLEEATTNPLEKVTAVQEYARLYMKQNEKFSDFLNTFRETADKAQVAHSSLRDDLWLRINFSLKNAMIPVEPDLVTFKQLWKRALHMDMQRTFAFADRSNGRFGSEDNPKVNSKTPVAKTSGYVPAPSFVPLEKSKTPGFRFTQTPAPTPAADKRDHGKHVCYNCGETGHISPNCTKPKSMAGIDLEAELNQLEVGLEPGNESS